jgi:hypothetical protein
MAQFMLRYLRLRYITPQGFDKRRLRQRRLGKRDTKNQLSRPRLTQRKFVTDTSSLEAEGTPTKRIPKA